jgi:hypothetical protein
MKKEFQCQVGKDLRSGSVIDGAERVKVVTKCSKQRGSMFRGRKREGKRIFGILHLVRGPSKPALPNSSLPISSQEYFF